MQTDFRSKELALLNYIEQNSDATQRQLSEDIGVSLGAINLLLKKLVEKGLVKIERLQPNSVQYFLTPAGIANKIERTYSYIARTYHEINRLRARIVEVIDALAQSSDAECILFFGNKDELQELIKDLIKTKSFIVEAKLHTKVEQLKHDGFYTQNVPVIIWDKKAESFLEEAGIESINIMGMLSV